MSEAASGRKALSSALKCECAECAPMRVLESLTLRERGPEHRKSGPDRASGAAKHGRASKRGNSGHTDAARSPDRASGAAKHGRASKRRAATQGYDPKASAATQGDEPKAAVFTNCRRSPQTADPAMDMLIPPATESTEVARDESSMRSRACEGMKPREIRGARRAPSSHAV